MNNAMNEIRSIEKKLFALGYAANVIGYDDATVAPPESYPGRGEALAELSALCHGFIVNSSLPRLMDEAEQGELSAQEKAELRELRKEYNRICRIPAEEYAEFSKLISESQNIWSKAKAASDFNMFAPNLEKIVEKRRYFASLLDPSKDPYDVYLDQFEPGLTTEKCDSFFAELKAGIVPLLNKIIASPNKPDTSILQGPWDINKQRRLSPMVMELIGLDSNHVAIGESEHPFTTEFYNGDVRITTHYYEDEMLSNLYSVVHEGGHALYESHISDKYFGTCLSGGVSMGIHESQSRMFENCIGRSRDFISCIMPMLKEVFPERFNNADKEELYRAVNICSPGLIRTEADEVTYCLHIILRYELEKKLMSGEITVRELPEQWNKLMKELLGLEVPCDAKGVLQDIHWAGGDLGYFPSYALGTAYAAQFMEAMKKELPLFELIEKGDFAPVNAWLTEHNRQYGSEHSPECIKKNACGEDFSPRY